MCGLGQQRNEYLYKRNGTVPENGRIRFCGERCFTTNIVIFFVNGALPVSFIVAFLF